MPSSSFYTDGETYDTSYTTPGDVPGATEASQAPSSFYPEGDIYDALAEESNTVATMQELLAQTQASQADASNHDTSAGTHDTNAAASASAAATSAAASAATVQAAAGTATPRIDGAAAVGTSTKWAHEDHVHPTDTSRAPLASPALTGSPTAPTVAFGDNTTHIATTAWVNGELANTAPIMDGVAAVGVTLRMARQDHVHPTDTSRAPLASPAFTGTPAAPTATAGTNTTQMATTAFVTGAVAAEGAARAAADVLLAPLASPALTGSPTAPTQTVGDNSTKLATTAFVIANGAAAGVSSIAGNTGAFTLSTGLAHTGNALRASLPFLQSALSSDVAIVTVNTFVDGPSVAQGASGSWDVTAMVTINVASTSVIQAKLWDGTTIVASTEIVILSTTTASQIVLSGIFTNPTGNIRISVCNATAGVGTIKASLSGLGKDSTIKATNIA